MSSTKRGGQRSEADWYATPAWVLDRLLDASPQLRATGGRWLDPGAGDGALMTAIECYQPPPGLTWKAPGQWAVELREEMRPHLVGLPERVCCPQDYLEWHSKAQFTVVITNPPFSLALDFIEHTIKFVNTRYLVLLLRLNFFASEKRHPIFKKYMPTEVFVLPNRPSFTDGRKTDSIEYAWFVWDLKAGCPDHAKLRVLDLTPKSVRRPS